VKRARVLVVEDERIVAMDIQGQLENLDYDVVATAVSGDEAIHKAEETSPDLALMDIRIKGDMDGIEVAQHLRAKLDIPVIYLTAYADQDTLDRAKNTESFGYLLKPFEEGELHATIEMALYKHRAERRLRESEQWLATTLQSIGDAVIATDAEGRVKFLNPVAQRLTGWTQKAGLGKDLSKVFHLIDGETRETIPSPATRAMAEGTTVHLQANVLLVARDGRTIPIDDSAAPIMDDRDNIDGVVLVFRDISERIQTEQKLRRYAAELKVQNQELDAFAHTVAHDLKDPLAAIVGFADVLKNDIDRMPLHQTKTFLRNIARDGRRMSNIIDELLLLASVRDAAIEPRPLDMATIVSLGQRRLAYMAQQHQAEIIVHEPWPVAMGYGPWIEEVWVNYISNGIKYGGRPPRIELGATPQPDGMIRFWVRDNGNGLLPEAKARLFTPFTQLDQLRARGHGLGLSIVRRIVEKLNGQVSVESTVGRGSTFTFTLPAAPEIDVESEGTERRVQ
jgi:PAS domain S-box-containing protein